MVPAAGTSPPCSTATVPFAQEQDISESFFDPGQEYFCYLLREKVMGSLQHLGRCARVWVGG